nr:MAG TPA: hypothetical protein [Caudoviricetes sp.]
MDFVPLKVGFCTFESWILYLYFLDFVPLKVGFCTFIFL